MNKTKIDWATMSWNPVTGCRHGCPYCYARRTAHRFDAGCVDPDPLADGLHVLEEKILSLIHISAWWLSLSPDLNP